jgi:hypothetical protein
MEVSQIRVRAFRFVVIHENSGISAEIPLGLSFRGAHCLDDALPSVEQKDTWRAILDAEEKLCFVAGANGVPIRVPYIAATSFVESLPGFPGETNLGL